MESGAADDSGGGESGTGGTASTSGAAGADNRVLSLQQQLVRTQEAAAKEIQQLQAQTARLSSEKLALEQSMLKQSSHVSSIEDELKILRHQIEQDGGSSGADSVTVRVSDSSDSLSSSKSKGATLPYSTGSGGSSSGGRGSALAKLSNNTVTTGLVNCLSLVSDRKLSKRGAAVYLLAIHVLMLFMSLHCYVF